MNYKRLLSISLGHFALDILASSTVIIFTVLATPFNLTVGQISLAVMLQMMGSSLTQPFFGILADRLQGRWMGAVGLLWMAIFYMLIPFMTNFPSLVICLSIGSLGSGALHAVGMVNASAAGGDYPATATSIFFLMGRSGLAVGPLLSGFILQNNGVDGLPYMALGTLPAVILMGVFLSSKDVSKAPTAVQPVDQKAKIAPQTTINFGFAAILSVIGFVIFQATVHQSYITLLPKYLDDLGYMPAVYGSILSAFTFAGAVGAFLGGPLGDKISKRAVLLWSMVLSIPFLFWMMRGGELGFWVAGPIASGLLSLPHSILIVMVQRMWPNNKGMMGGAILGLMFASGATTAWIAGQIADVAGLDAVLMTLVCVPIAAIACTFFLPEERQESVSTLQPSAGAAD
ncbi:MAG: MFS transporter [Chloroflexota bacterium]